MDLACIVDSGSGNPFEHSHRRTVGCCSSTFQGLDDGDGFAVVKESKGGIVGREGNLNVWKICLFMYSRGF